MKLRYNTKKYFIYGITGFSIIINILFLYIEIRQRNSMHEFWRMLCIQNPPLENTNEFKEQIIIGAQDILTKGINIPEQYEYTSLKEKIGNLFYNKKSNFNDIAFKYGENAFLMESLLEYAFYTRNKQIDDFVIKKFDENILNESNTLKKVDQVPYGCVAIELYEITHKKKYKDYAQLVFNFLSKRDTTNIGILYSDGERQNVEATGYICPFLMKYSSYFNCTKAKDIAIRQIENYCKYACDPNNGMPTIVWKRFPPYNALYSNNWGRGNAWFCIGLLSVKESDLTDFTQNIIKKYCNTLINIYKRNGAFHQYLDLPETGIALDAELPLLYFLHKKNKLILHKKDLLKYSQYLQDGVLYHSSGVYHQLYGPCYIVGSSNRLSSAFMIKLLNEIP